MDNGERRFRLIADQDFTSYIRTENSGVGAWQNAHYHESVLETYIVQKGWIVACELVDEQYKYTKYDEGAIFTTRPLVVHNVYMPAGAVIHTVKHGPTDPAKPIDRVSSGPAPEEMTKINRSLSETELLKLVLLKPQPAAAGQGAQVARSTSSAPEGAVTLYNEVYRHFDTLIWQTPAWSVAVLTIAFFAAANTSETSALTSYLALPEWKWLQAGIFACFGLFLVLLSYALYRFRWHQAGVIPGSPAKKYFRTQAALQLFISLEAFTLLILSLRGVTPPAGFDWIGPMTVSILLAALLSLHYLIENSVYSRSSAKPKRYDAS